MLEHAYLPDGTEIRRLSEIPPHIKLVLVGISSIFKDKNIDSCKKENSIKQNLHPENKIFLNQKLMNDDDMLTSDQMKERLRKLLNERSYHELKMERKLKKSKIITDNQYSTMSSNVELFLQKKKSQNASFLDKFVKVKPILWNEGGKERKRLAHLLGKTNKKDRSRFHKSMKSFDDAKEIPEHLTPEIINKLELETGFTRNEIYDFYTKYKALCLKTGSCNYQKIIK